MSYPRCEVCGAELCGRGPSKTGACYSCLRAGARFVRVWAADLRAGGLKRREIAEVIGTTPAAAGAQLRRAVHGSAA